MVIRPFRPQDQPATRLLILEGLGEHFGYVDETLNPDLDNIERCYLQPGHIFLVAEDDTGLVGSGALMLLEQAGFRWRNGYELTKDAENDIVIPAEAGIQCLPRPLDARIRGHDAPGGEFANRIQAVGQIVRVSVSQQHRQRGIGSAIVQRLLRIARQRSLRRVQVETNNDWHNATKLYRRHGFVEYARDEVSVYMALDLS